MPGDGGGADGVDDEKKSENDRQQNKKSENTTGHRFKSLGIASTRRLSEQPERGFRSAEMLDGLNRKKGYSGGHKSL
jgi:hypothetical protein